MVLQNGTLLLNCIVNRYQYGHSIRQGTEKIPDILLEEPVHPLNAQSMNRVAQKVNIPIASGERIYSRWGYRTFPGKSVF